MTQKAATWLMFACTLVAVTLNCYLYAELEQAHDEADAALRQACDYAARYYVADVELWRLRNDREMQRAGAVRRERGAVRQTL